MTVLDSRALWSAYSAGDSSARDRLLTEHLSLVHHVARQLARGLSTNADMDELVSAGTIGLINALESFDHSRGLALSTFAVPRIRGAILDELRRQDHAPRSVRRKARDIGVARQALMSELGRLPDDRAVAERLNVDLDTLWKWQADAEGAVHVPLERSSHDSDEGPQPRAALIANDDEPGIEDLLNMDQEVVILKEALRNLKEQERVVLALYYYEELKLHQIAEILELTESRVSQIRTKALSRLRQELAPLRENIA